jgi:hypothetical protein
MLSKKITFQPFANPPVSPVHCNWCGKTEVAHNWQIAYLFPFIRNAVVASFAVCSDECKHAFITDQETEMFVAAHLVAMAKETGEQMTLEYLQILESLI